MIVVCVCICIGMCVHLYNTYTCADIPINRPLTTLQLPNQQLCLILGLPLYFGPARVMRLLFNKDKLRASACFCLGVFLVLRGNSFLGTLLEVFGFFNLFAYVHLCCLCVHVHMRTSPHLVCASTHH